MQADVLNRFRITFNVDGPLRWVGHLDLVRTWERVIRRSGLTLAYSKGYTPHPRIALAAPLAVGISGQNELMDIWLEGKISPLHAQNELATVLSPGLSIQSTKLVALNLPPMQSLLKSAQYKVIFEQNLLNEHEVTKSINTLLEKNILNWEEIRGKKKRTYDLRATIIDLQLFAMNDSYLHIEMNLSMEEKRTGRPHQILRALDIDIDPHSMVRTHIEMFPAKVG